MPREAETTVPDLFAELQYPALPADGRKVHEIDIFGAVLIDVVFDLVNDQ